MKISCVDGYFIVKQDEPDEIARFNTLFQQDLLSHEDYFTFELLKSSPNYSVVGKPYLGVPATKTYSGLPWQVMKENGFTYDFILKKVVPISTVTYLVNKTKALGYEFSNGLFVAGSRTRNGQFLITGYNCTFDLSDFTYRYTEIFYG